MSDTTPETSRIASLDQFRGYTVLGMFLVNFVGSYVAVKSLVPVLCHHHTYCSYADTIMPQFFFAVGFAYRLTFLRRLAASGPGVAYRQALKRNLGLILVGLVIHGLDGRFESWEKLQSVGFSGVWAAAFQRNFFQTLTHIGVTALWVMPVIAARPTVRILFAILSAVLFHACSEWGYYDWVLKRPGIDGGPLGFLTWTVPLIVGTLASDAMAANRRWLVVRLLVTAVGLMALGYGLSCVPYVTSLSDLFSSGWTQFLIEPPFVRPTRAVNIWTMSQRAGSVTYLIFGAGFSLAIYTLFVLACDRLPLRVGIFRTLGTNALLGYIIHDLVNAAIKPFVPKDSPVWFVFSACGVSLLICYTFLRSLEKQRLFLKL